MFDLSSSVLCLHMHMDLHTHMNTHVECHWKAKRIFRRESSLASSSILLRTPVDSHATSVT